MAASVAITTTVVITTRDDEPEYKGRKLSEWVIVYKFGIPGRQTFEASQALSAMTPQILPTLVRQIRYEKSVRAGQIEDFIEPVAEKLGLARPFNSITQREEHSAKAALDVFQVLGTNAMPAMPQLSNMVMDANHPHAAANALEAMSATGQVGLQTIICLLHNQNNPNRPATLAALTLCSQRAPPIVVEQIRQHLTNSDAEMRRVATNALKALH